MSVHSSYPSTAYSVEVSTSAVFRRLKRKLARQAAKLHKCHQRSPWWSQRGDFYTTDANNHIIDTHIDLVATAQELFVLCGWETVVR